MTVKNDSESFLKMTRQSYGNGVTQMEKNTLRQKTMSQRPGCTVSTTRLGIVGMGSLKRLVRLRSEIIFWF